MEKLGGKMGKRERGAIRTRIDELFEGRFYNWRHTFRPRSSF